MTPEYVWHLWREMATNGTVVWLEPWLAFKRPDAHPSETTEER